MAEGTSKDLQIPELSTSFFFRRRPIAVPGDLRPAWRIGLLMLLLKKCCRQSRSSLTRLHVLDWAVRTPEHQPPLLALLSKSVTPDSLIVRFDPALNRAIDFAIGEGLVQRFAGSRIELTREGDALASDIIKNEELYPAEKSFVDKIRQQVTEGLVDQVFGMR